MIYIIGEKIIELANITGGLLIFEQLTQENYNQKTMFISIGTLLFLYTFAIIMLKKGAKHA